jgi:hypothetical protein
MEALDGLVIALIFAVIISLHAQQHGLDSRAAIGAFANGHLPGAMLAESGSWQLVSAFPGLQTAFEDPVFLCAALHDLNRL